VNDCEREAEAAIADVASLATPAWSRHLAGCEACSHTVLIRSLLQTNAKELTANAPPSSAEGLLWQFRLRRSRERYRQVALMFAIANISLASAAAALILGGLWVALLDSRVGSSDEMVAVIAFLTLLAFSIVVAAGWTVANPLPRRAGRY
jgi:hypothetical protein